MNAAYLKTFSLLYTKCSVAIMPRLRPTSVYLVFPVFTAKPISLKAFHNTSTFISNVLCVTLPVPNLLRCIPGIKPGVGILVIWCANHQTKEARLSLPHNHNNQ